METYLGHELTEVDTVNGFTVYRDDVGNVVLSQQVAGVGTVSATVTNVVRLVTALNRASLGGNNE